MGACSEMLCSPITSVAALGHAEGCRAGELGQRSRLQGERTEAVGSGSGLATVGSCVGPMRDKCGEHTSAVPLEGRISNVCGRHGPAAWQGSPNAIVEKCPRLWFAALLSLPAGAERSLGRAPRWSVEKYVA